MVDTLFCASQATIWKITFALRHLLAPSHPLATRHLATGLLVSRAPMVPGLWLAQSSAEFAHLAMTAQTKLLSHPQYALMVTTKSVETWRVLFARTPMSATLEKLWLPALFGIMLIAQPLEIACLALTATTAPRVLRSHVPLEPTVRLRI